MRIFGVAFSRDIHRIQLAHTLRSVALSFVGVYVPIFLLTHGFSLSDTIIFFVVFHAFGLAFGLTMCPLAMRRWGMTQTLRASYFPQIAFFVALHFLPQISFVWPIVAVLGGIATFAYWMPLNILFVKHAETKKMGSDLGLFFALPKIFGVAGPLVSAAVIPFFGFWPMFIVAGCGLILSYLPLIAIEKHELMAEFRLSQSIQKIRKRKFLFFLEGFDNIIEESEWFWGIFVFLLIGSLVTPGIVGGLEALGGALFAILVGKFANQHALKLIPIASVGLMALWAIRFFIESPFSAYLASLSTSFVMTLFIVTYFSFIYKKIKNDDEETFLILREIPTVLGRFVVFGCILLTAVQPKYFFILPIFAISLLLLFLFLRRKQLTSSL